MRVKLLTEIDLKFLSLKGRCAGSAESTLVKCHIVGNHMSRLISFVSLHTEKFEIVFSYQSLQQCLNRCVIDLHAFCMP